MAEVLETLTLWKQFQAGQSFRQGACVDGVEIQVSGAARDAARWLLEPFGVVFYGSLAEARESAVRRARDRVSAGTRFGEAYRGA